MKTGKEIKFSFPVFFDYFYKSMSYKRLNGDSLR